MQVLRLPSQRTFRVCTFRPEKCEILKVLHAVPKPNTARAAGM